MKTSRLTAVHAAIACALMYFGMRELRNARVDVFPEFAPPRVEIQVPSLGLSAKEVEELVTVPIEDALIMEYRMTQVFMAGHDFFEGIRALLVDKDQSPKWQPPTLAEVTPADVARYFQPLGANDLKFD